MYIASFYSFKGGVGRSMALVNVAADLAQRGKRVLIVDFDLEAPGLDSFDLTTAGHGGRGLVDFVCDFRDAGEVPDVMNYIYRAQGDLGEGELWVMPAGSQDESYHNRFRSIDWADLYDNHSGFLLFEDLKAQWSDTLKVDYVLIDSRTGHTDAAGICTRQLPNAVVTFFFPNEQNRRGLRSIVSQIRNEAKGPLKKKIDLHFVMSNVPDLDDEDEILENEIRRFEDSLEFDSPTAVIHHYDSLALLEQVTFTVKRRRSRLAKEYADLTSAIVRKNLADPVGALAFLGMVGRRTSTTTADLEDQLQDIRISHAKNAEVLKNLALVRVRQRKIKEAVAILSQAVQEGFREPEILLRRAQLYSALSQRDLAIADLKEILASERATSYELGIGIRSLREIQSDLVPLISRSPALDRIGPDIELIQELESSAETLSVAVRLLSRWLAQSTEEAEQYDFRDLRIHLVLCLIGKGSFKEALAVYGEDRVNPENLIIPDCFNYAMALWASEGIVPSAYLHRVAELKHDFGDSRDPNNLQCLSLVSYLLGDEKQAFRLLERAREMSVARGASSFSCWSYLQVSVERFASELDEMSASYKDGQITPEFMKRNTQGLPTVIVTRS